MKKIIMTFCIPCFFSMAVQAKTLEKATVYSAKNSEHADHYRIPSVVKAPNEAGDLLAFAERRLFDDARGKQHGDRCDIDLVVKVSRDAGQSWYGYNNSSEETVITGTNSFSFDFDGDSVKYDKYCSYHNIVPVVDYYHKKVYLLYNLSYNENNRYYDANRDKDDNDDGVVESVNYILDRIHCRIIDYSSKESGSIDPKVHDITQITPNNSVNKNFNMHLGPGHGITAKNNGKAHLIVPFQYKDANTGKMFISFMYLDTYGWRVSKHFFYSSSPEYKPTEVTVGVTQYADLYFNVRENKGTKRRLVGVLDSSDDWFVPLLQDKDGQSDEAPDYSHIINSDYSHDLYLDNNLVDPTSHGSLLNARATNNQNFILFSNSACANFRRFLTIKRSLDTDVDSQITWSKGKLLFNDPGKSVEYSDLVHISKSFNGIIYEYDSGKNILFSTFSNKWLTSGLIANWDFRRNIDEVLLNGALIRNTETVSGADGVVRKSLEAKKSGYTRFGGGWVELMDNRLFTNSNGGKLETHYESEINDIFDFDANEGFEIHTKFRTTKHRDSKGGAIWARDSGGYKKGTEIYLRVKNKKIQLFVRHEHGSTRITSFVDANRDVTDGEWHSVVASRKNGKLFLAVDGLMSSTVDKTWNYDLHCDNNLRIGNFVKGNNVFIGDLVYLKVYSDCY